jgi:hypothetical protein
MSAALLPLFFLFARLSLFLVALFGLLLGAMHLEALDNVAITDFGDCAMPCWQDVQPGVTGRADALARLKALGWILREQCNPAVYQACYNFARAASDPIAFVYVDQEVVRQIALVRSRLRLGDLWLALGSPESSAIAPRTYRASWLNAALWFDPGNVSTRMKFACPIGFANMLRSPIDTILVWEEGTSMRGTTLDSPADLRRTVFQVCG